MSDFCTWGKHTSAFMLELCGINRVLWEGLVHPVNSSVLGWILFHQQQKSSSLDTLIVSGYIIVFTNPAACDIFAFRVAWLRDSFPQDYCSASVSVTSLSVNISKKEPEKMLKGLEGNILHFLENFNQCYTTNLAVLRRWSWECSHGGCQGIDSLDSLGQKTPLRSSDHVFSRLTDEWVLQKPQIHTGPTIYQPQIPPRHVQTLQTPGTWMFLRTRISFMGSQGECVWGTRECLHKCFGYDALNCRKRGTIHCHREWICSSLEIEPDTPR